MPKHVFTREDCRKGAVNQPRSAKVDGGKKGFEKTCETHPFFARHWLQYCRGMKRANGTRPEKREV